jgi:hypothetical protein
MKESEREERVLPQLRGGKQKNKKREKRKKEKRKKGKSNANEKQPNIVFKQAPPTKLNY